MSSDRPCDEQACEAPRRSLQIGMTAYECIPGLVFVRVPNERGRWLLTDRCVAEVDCPHCGSIAGEPCSNHQHAFWRAMPPKPDGKRYSVGVHVGRKYVSGRWKDKGPKPKLRVRVEDIREAQSVLPDMPERPYPRGPLVLPRRAGGVVTVGDVVLATDLQYPYILGLCQSGTVEAHKERNVWMINEASFRSWWEDKNAVR